MTKVATFDKTQLKKDLPEIRSGDTVKVYQKIKEKDKERIQVFEGVVLARKHGKGLSATIAVRKVISGIGVERTFPLHSPNIEKIEIVRRGKARRAKLYYLRKAKGRKARLKKVELKEKVGLRDRVVVKQEKDREEKEVQEGTPQEKPVEEKTQEKTE
jgi:large subunit ribosomal protein L19